MDSGPLIPLVNVAARERVSHLRNTQRPGFPGRFHLEESWVRGGSVLKGGLALEGDEAADLALGQVARGRDDVVTVHPQRRAVGELGVS